MSGKKENKCCEPIKYTNKSVDYSISIWFWLFTIIFLLGGIALVKFLVFYIFNL